MLGVENTQHGHTLEVIADCVAEEVLTADACFFAACTNIGFADLDGLTVSGLRYLLQVEPQSASVWHGKPVPEQVLPPPPKRSGKQKSVGQSASVAQEQNEF